MRALVVVLALVVAACSKDSSGPSGLPPNLLAAYCVRGDAALGQTKSGSVTDNDCDSADIDASDSSFYEVWHIRVNSTTSVTFDANSAFDNYLVVLRLDSYTTTTASLTVIGENDDREPENLNALVTVTLQAGVDYFVSVSGYDYDQTGSYTLQIYD